MEIFNFENLGHNFLHSNRLVLKLGGIAHNKSTAANDFRTGNIFAEKSGKGDEDKPKTDTEAGKDDKGGKPKKGTEGTESLGDKSKTGTKDKLSKAKKSVENKPRKQIKITETVRNKFRKGMGKEIYGGNEALRKRYREGVREAIEVMDKDKLYDFIKNHTPPKQAYGKGSFDEWNGDFAQLIVPEIPDEYSDLKESPDLDVKQRYLVGGLQQYLLDEFETDVFEATVSKKNPFISVDGRLGAYTISVMAAHWNKEFKLNDAKKRPSLRYGALGGDYASNRRNSVLYNDAIAHLNSQVGLGGRKASSSVRGVVAKKGPKKGPSVKPGVNTQEVIREALIAENATDEAVFAFDSAYNKAFIPAIREVLKELKAECGFTRKSPDSWEEVHNRLSNKNSPHFNQAYLDEYGITAPATTPTVTPAPAPTASGKPKVAQKPAIKKALGENLPKAKFLRTLQTRINRSEFDFNDIWVEDKSKESLTVALYDMCNRYNLPTTKVAIGEIIKSLKRNTEENNGEDINYGGEGIGHTDTQMAEQKAFNRRIVNNVSRDMRRKFLGEKLVSKDSEPMNKDEFVVEMITEINNNRDIDFLSGGFEYDAREAFAKNAYKICQTLKIPTSMKMMKEIIDILQNDYMPADNDVEYYNNPDGADEISANNLLMNGIQKELADKYNPQPKAKQGTQVAVK